MPKGHKQGFRSKAQWRLFFANPRLRRHAKKWARRTPGGKVVRYRRLPERVGARKRRKH
jgi:hypothetical protein